MKKDKKLQSKFLMNLSLGEIVSFTNFRGLTGLLGIVIKLGCHGFENAKFLSKNKKNGESLKKPLGFEFIKLCATYESFEFSQSFCFCYHFNLIEENLYFLDKL